ncbi:MAG: hypothetical protein O7D29_05445 [Gemmatimonadetes bacterium]|nr:hypothetical protein [Gemmatimonadota bacterium]MCZ6861746.1 hypothetical protein [Alphaproteobacteria bacterium]
MNKEHERFFVEEAAKRLGTTWSLSPDRERPDFLVTEGTQNFGLEVSEVFMGPQGPAGAAMKKRENETQKAVDALRFEYEEITKIPLRVQFLGDMCAENMAKVVPALIAEDFASKPILHHADINLGDRFSAHVTKAFNAEWFSVNDRVGWVDRDPTKCIADAVEKKSRKLPAYREATGLDIRLLLVADRINNSGKLMLKERPALDVRGFQVVYFFSYPEDVIVFY